MKVVHTTMVYADGQGNATYRSMIMDLRWNNKAKGKWSGKSIEYTGDGDVLHFDKGYTFDEREAICEQHSRDVAKRLGIPAGPDTFPYA